VKEAVPILVARPFSCEKVLPMRRVGDDPVEIEHDGRPPDRATGGGNPVVGVPGQGG